MVGPDVVIGDGVELKSHVAIAGRTTIGARTVVFPFASLGHQPQDLKYKGEPSTLRIGADCIIREGVTMNPGTEGGGMKTVVGDKCVFLGNSHVGHDCIVGNNVDSLARRHARRPRDARRLCHRQRRRGGHPVRTRRRPCLRRRHSPASSRT